MATKSFSYTISSTIYENSPFKQNLRNTSSAVPSDINSINIIDIKVTATDIVTDELTLGLGFSSTNLTSYALTYPDNKTATMTVTSSSSSWNSLISAVKNTGDVILYGSMQGQSNTGLIIEVVVNYTPVTSNTSDGGISSGNVPVLSGPVGGGSIQGPSETNVSNYVFFSSYNNTVHGENGEPSMIFIANNGQSYEPIKFKVTITVRDLPDGYNFYYGYTEYPTDENEVTNDNDGGNFTISFDINPSDMDWEKYYNMYTNHGQILTLYLLSQDVKTSADVEVSVVTWNPTDKSVTYSTSSQTVNIDAITGVNNTHYELNFVMSSGGSTNLTGFTLNGTTLTIPAGRTAGTYNVNVTAWGWDGSLGKTITKGFNLVINKANAHIYFEPDDGWTYDGTSHSLGTVSYLGDGDLYYALTTVEGNVNKASIDAAVASYINYGGTFTKIHDGDTISTTNAGQYVFMAYSTAGINYNASYSPTSPLHYDDTFDVYKATPKFEGHSESVNISSSSIARASVSASVVGTVHYGTTTAMGSTVTISDPKRPVILATKVFEEGTTTVYAWFEPTDKRNYNNVGSTTSGYITVTATLTSKETPTVSFQYSTRTYNGSVQYEQFKSNVAGRLYIKEDVVLTNYNYVMGTKTNVAANTWTNCTQATYPGVWHMNYYFVPTDTSTYNKVTPSPHDFVMQKADDNFTFSPENITTTYSDTGQNVTITSATGAHGTLSYEVTAVVKVEGYLHEFLEDNPTRGWEITSGTTLHIPANSVSNAGTYYVTVRATSAESSYYNETTKTANFYVDINKASIRHDTFTISPTSETIYNVGKINFTITPANSLGSVTYSSSNTNVANAFTEVEYLQGNGSSYLDTGLYGTNDTEVEIKFAQTSTSSSYGLFGYNSGNLKISLCANGNTNALQIFGDQSQQIALMTSGTVIFNKSSLKVIPIHGAESNYTFASKNKFTTEGTMKMFSYYDATHALPGKVYYCKVRENGKLVADFVPVKNTSGVYGMYDKVRKTFYTSETSTAFTGGNVFGNNTIVSYVGSGNCTITATDSGNSNYESATATCDVTCIKDYLDTTKYKNTRGTAGYNITSYGTPNTPTLNTTNLTAAGGTIAVSGSTVINNISYYQKYHFQTNLYSDLQKGTNTGIVWYKITSQEFLPNSSGSLSLVISRFSISGSTVTHTTMDTYSGYDIVYVAAYNTERTSNVSTPAKASVQNKVESISMTFDNNVNVIHLVGAGPEYQIRYNNTAEVFVDAHYTSGSKDDVSNSATITSEDTTIIKVN